MATPSYIGAGQRIGTPDGWLARIGSFFTGSGTPSYVGSGQPQPTTTGGFLRGAATPIYAAAPPATEPAGQTDSLSDAGALAQQNAVIQMCPIDPAALAAGQIAIVIPRERLGPCP